MAARQNRDQNWASVIRDWRASGISQKEFCRQRGIADRALNNWLYKSPYRERMARLLAIPAPGDADKETPRFVPVSVIATTPATAPHTGSPAIEIVLENGLPIAVSPGFDQETLRRVVAVLEARPC